MTESPNLPLVLDLLDWLGDAGRPYAEVMAAWRTSCPRLAIWEDALAAGLVRRVKRGGAAARAERTDAGLRLLVTRLPRCAPPARAPGAR